MEQNSSTQPPKKDRHRSPNYPGISLKAAVDKIGIWFKGDGPVASPRDAALKLMGFEKFTGDAGRLLSALKSFGLIQEADGRIKLTQRGVDIAARPEDDPKRLVALKEAALSPPIYKQLMKEFPDKLPTDTTLKSELVAAKKFNPKAVDDFIKDFKSTLDFAGLSDYGVLGSGLDEEGNDLDAVKIGDLVQWELGGVLQFPEPRRITAFSEDGSYGFVEGSPTGLLVKELTVVEAVAPETQQDKLNTDPMKPPKAKDSHFIPPKMRSYAWALSGDFSAKLDLFGDAQTEDDLDALADYVEITIKALKRSLKKATS